MRFYVAFRTDVVPTKRYVSGSFNRLRRRLRKLPKGSEFTIATFNITPNLDNLCQAVEDVTELGAEDVADYHINEQRQLRRIKT